MNDTVNSTDARVLASTTSALLLWDCDSEPPTWHGPLLLWRSFAKEPKQNLYSLPEIIDSRAEEFRQKYLKLVHEWGVASIGGRTMIERLIVREQLSYWWLTLPAQKDIYAYSPYIYDVLKLFAFEELAASLPGRRPIHLYTSNRKLERVLRNWCGKQGREFACAWAPKPAGETTSIRGLRRRLPLFVRGVLAFLNFIFERWRFRTGQRSAASPDGIAVFDIFTHLGKDGITKGVFESNYWSGLAIWLEQSRIPVGWFHWYYQYPLVPNMQAATSLARDFSKSRESQHQIVDAPLPLRSIARVVRDLLKINLARISLGKADKIFRVPNSDLDVWPLLEDDWANSFYGPRAVLSLFHLNALEQLLEGMPHQSLGIYIQENQPWELALCQLWRSHGHGMLVGVAHTTVPFWDLRYFFDCRAFENTALSVPQPDLMALNGPDALGKIRKSGYPANRCCEVEALRYLSLRELMLKKTSQLHESTQEAPGNKRIVRLLVLGDLLPQYTDRQFQFLQACSSLQNLKLKLRFRPHPAAADLTWKVAGVDFSISTGRLVDELVACDAVFVGSATSAASDAYQVGIPVISLNDGDKINFSPVYRAPDVRFVNSPADLAAAIVAVATSTKPLPGRFFTIDEEIPRWKSLIDTARDRDRKRAPAG